MQGNKKGTDGFSDTSSIGSVLDDADREVSNLTDRAFRSLCISEDTSFHDLALSPDITSQVSGTFHQGTVSHTNRKSGIWSQLPSQGTEHSGWAATFQQQPKYVQGEEKYPKNSPPPTPAQRRLEVPISGLRNSGKPISKVSSLIRSFDRTETQPCDSRPPPSKPPALKNPLKFAPPPEGGVNFCFDSAFLTVRRVPAEVSSTHQSNHQPSRIPGEQESPKNPEVACHSSDSLLRTPEHVADSCGTKFPSPPIKPAKAEPGRGKEWVPRGTFLHSENSAFESWTSHQPKLPERKDIAETIPESKAPKHYEDMPLLKDPHTSESKVSPCQVQANNTEEETGSASGPQSILGAWGAKDSGSQVFPVEGNASQTDPQMKRSQPPWRKPKTGKGGTDGLHDALEDKKQPNRRGLPLYSKLNPQGQLPENGVIDMPEDPNDHYSPPFNISKLLTPIINTKNVLESSDTQPVEISPSPPEQLNGYQDKEPSEAQSRDSYKSKAPSLLFNLKDVRKRVKTTYSPMPLLKSSDERTRGKLAGKQEPESNGVTLPKELEEHSPTEPLNEMPASILHSSTQKDPTNNSTESFADSHPTPSSPSASSKIHICANGEATERSSNEKHDANGASEQGPSKCGWHPDSRECLPRKHLTLKLYNKESETGQAMEKKKPHQLENGLSRSISQETETEQETGLQNLPLNSTFCPGPLSPEEDDVFYSDSQSDFTPCLQTKAKFSTSSSDQSFASFDDQQKMWFTEGLWEDRKNRVSVGDDKKGEKETMMEKDEPQQCALSNGHIGAEDHGQEEIQRKAQGWSGGTPKKASVEKANFGGSWVEADKDTALPHAKDSTPLPASSNKHRLFPIKDNTLRATPVIKPIILPLLRTMSSSEDSLSGGHKESELPRQPWDKDAVGFCASESQEMRDTPLSSNTLGTQQKCVVCEGQEEDLVVHTAAQAEISQQAQKGSFSFLPLEEEEGKMKPPSDITGEASARGQSRSEDSGKLATPQHIPTITLPQDDLEDPPPSRPLHTYWEEQGFQSHFLSAPRAGPSGRRLVPSEAGTSPNPSSLDESRTCSPAASSVWEEASQAPGEQWLRQEPLGPSPLASPGRARLTRREDMTHNLTWEAEGYDPQLEQLADLRTLSPRGALLADAAEKPEPPALLEKAAGKPPAVPPKTEKALRRAKKLASKRRKSDQAPAKHTEAWEGKSYTEDAQGTERRPMSPGKGPRPRLSAVRFLPPPTHRHSVSCGWEPSGRRPWGTQPLTPLPPYPATQKVLQDPQSGQYFVFDVPLQVKIKTFYDPETGKYVKVSVPSSEDASSEPPLQDSLAAPYLLYPGFRPVPVTSLMPLRCSSQLAAPTFLRQGSGHRPRSSQGARLQPPPDHLDEFTQHASTQRPHGLPHRPEEEGAEAPSLSIISTDDLEDFATEGVS
ncbi:hypothetical protein HispidOSU_002354 [Sigmodon hispidus]